MFGIKTHLTRIGEHNHFGLWIANLSPQKYKVLQGYAQPLHGMLELLPDDERGAFEIN